MAGYVEQDGYGSLFRNNNKTKDTHPDRRGTLTWRGEQLEVVGWLKKKQDGEDFLSLAVKVKEQQGQPPAQVQPQTAQPPAQPPVQRPVPVQAAQPQAAQPQHPVPAQQPTEKARILEAYGVLVRENEAAAIGLRDSRGFASWDAVKACDNIGTLATLVADLEELKAGTQDDGIPF